MFLYQKAILSNFLKRQLPISTHQAQEERAILVLVWGGSMSAAGFCR